MKLLDAVHHLTDDHRSQPARRFVEKEQPRLRHQRCADREHLLLTARHGTGGKRTLIPQDREHLVHGLDGFHQLAALCLAGVPAQQKVLLDGLLVKDPLTLLHVRHTLPHPLVRGNSGDVGTVHFDGSRGHLVEAGQSTERARLACTVAPEQGCHLTGIDVERDIPDDAQIAVPGLQVTDLQNRFHHFTSLV